MLISYWRLELCRSSSSAVDAWKNIFCSKVTLAECSILIDGSSELELR